MWRSWQASGLKWSERISLKTCLLTGAALITLQVLALLAMSLPPICRCGYVELWHANPSGPETSQHLFDWYTYTHVIHGFVFYLLLWLAPPRMSFGLRLAIAIGLEASWEIIENTPFIMDRYRQSALARGYFGDSVINSAADTFERQDCGNHRRYAGELACGLRDRGRNKIKYFGAWAHAPMLAGGRNGGKPALDVHL